MANGTRYTQWLRPGGFTLIELMVVMSIIALLASLAAPVVYKSVIRAKESALMETLQVTRSAIDDFYIDKGHYPDTLKQLVDDRYLRSLPFDPILKGDGNWQLESSYDVEGIVDLHSGADKLALDGTRYSEW
ncbi:MAG: type II secretion system GspH family protein [Pseudomonadales bacterium]|nr:type II secretion system GspH family protein [Pseudomonadales bacterium]